jgi:phosphoribosylformylglycinamidine synthase
MVLAVKPENLQELQQLADTFQTEMTVLGESDDSGVLRVWHNGELVVEMDNSKLHDAPTKYLTSVFNPAPALQGVTLDDSNLAADLKQVFGDFAIVSREPIIREYDHEVQGNTVLKPLAGATADAPQDASVIDIDGSDKLMSLALAILPEWGKTDPYAMGTGTVDETVRQLVLAGTNPDKIALLDNFCMGNPECPTELGRIVECAKGIREAALAYGAPYVSGKDSFYNYFETEEGPVNIPVTFLCSGFGVVEDPDHVRGASLRRNNSRIFIVGNTEDEMGASVYARIKGVKDCKVPQTDNKANYAIYKQYYEKALTQGLVLSAHDLSEGGLAVAAAEMAFSGKGGISIDLDKLPTVGGWQNNAVPCFSESTGRFLVEVDEDLADEFAAAMEGTPCACIGTATTDGQLTLTAKGSTVLQAEIAELKSIWKNGLTPFY